MTKPPTETNNTEPTMLELIEQQLQTVYDPEFPVIDIFTLGLIYEIVLNDEQQTINIVMTFTTPACPMGEMIEAMVENALLELFPTWHVLITITFDPMRGPQMIKDADLQRMFE